MRHARVAVGDREASFRRGVRLALAGSALGVVGEAESPGLLLSLVEDERPDAILVDERLLDAGLQTLPRLAELAPTAVVLAAPAAADLQRYFGCGARGCVDRAAAAPILLHDVAALAAGQLVVPSRLLTTLLATVSSHSRLHGGEQPTRRQAQVEALLRDGATSREIAAVLGISPVTVRRHLSESRRRRALAAGAVP